MGFLYHLTKHYLLVNTFGNQTLRNGNTAVVAFSSDNKDGPVDTSPSKSPSTIPARFAEMDPELGAKVVKAVSLTRVMVESSLR